MVCGRKNKGISQVFGELTAEVEGDRNFHSSSLRFTFFLQSCTIKINKVCIRTVNLHLTIIFHWYSLKL